MPPARPPTTSVTPPETRPEHGRRKRGRRRDAGRRRRTRTSRSACSRPGATGRSVRPTRPSAAAETSGADGATADGDPERRPEHERLDPGGERRHLGCGHAAERRVEAGQRPRQQALEPRFRRRTTGSTPNLSIVVDGDGLQQPGANGLQVWVWTWNWDRDEAAERRGCCSTRNPSSWNWIWGSANGQTGGAVRPGDVAVGEHATSRRPGLVDVELEIGHGRRAQLDVAVGLERPSSPCGSCIWIWNWTWNWTGQPVPTGSTAPTVQFPEQSPQHPSRRTWPSPNAEASVTARRHTDDRAGRRGAGGQFAGQLVSVEQAGRRDRDGDAVRRRVGRDRQSPRRPRSTASRASPPPPSPETSPSGPSRRCSSARRATVPRRSGAGRRSTSSSTRALTSDTGQRDVSLRTAGTVLAAGQASAATAADVDQRVVQDALVDGGDDRPVGGPVDARRADSADAVSVVEQTEAAGSRAGGHTARAHSLVRRARPASTRIVAQRAVRGGGLGSQTAMQIVYVGQAGFGERDDGTAGRQRRRARSPRATRAPRTERSSSSTVSRRAPAPWRSTSRI